MLLRKSDSDRLWPSSDVVRTFPLPIRSWGTLSPGVLTMADSPSLSGVCIERMSAIIVLLQVACCVWGPATGVTGCKQGCGFLRFWPVAWPGSAVDILAGRPGSCIALMGISGWSSSCWSHWLSLSPWPPGGFSSFLADLVLAGEGISLVCWSLLWC